VLPSLSDLTPPIASRVAAALVAIRSAPHSARPFSRTIGFMQENAILESAPRVSGPLSTRGLLAEGVDHVVVMLVAISNHSLLPELDGFEARRLLAALVTELRMSPEFAAGQEGRDLAILSSFLRRHIQKLSKSPTALPLMPQVGSLVDLVDWMSCQGLGSRQLSDVVKEAWIRTLREASLRVASSAPDYSSATPWGGDDGEDQESGVVSVQSAAEELGGRVEAFLIDDEIPALDDPGYSPGELRLIAERAGATWLSLHSLTCSSTLFLDDIECGEVAARLVSLVNDAACRNDERVLQSAAARALQLATGASDREVRQLRFGTPDDVREYGCVTVDIDFAFLIRPPLPLSAAKSRLGHPWIPIPPSLAKVLCRHVGESQKRGRLVFPLLRDSINSFDGINPSCLRRTFVSRLARCEPLGISTAQIATSDPLGLDTAPLHYERISANRLAYVVASVTFPWFGDNAGFLSKSCPEHILGSGILVDAREVANLLAGIRAPKGYELTGGLLGRVSHRTRNLVHGVFAAAGHRPSSGIERITLERIDLETGLATLSDKKAGPEWPHRPVALPPSICREIRCLVAELTQVSVREDCPRSAAAALAAVTGKGPLLLSFLPGDQASPFSLQDYLADLPPQLAKTPNFARHHLCQQLIGRLSEMHRVAQLGWHGTREGAFADGSPCSVVEACETISMEVERHLASIGWRPLGTCKQNAESLPVSMNWRRREVEHRRRFLIDLKSLKKAHAQRDAQAARDCFPTLRVAFAEVFPALRLESLVQIQRAGEPEQASAVKISRDAVAQVERILANHCEKPERVAARNVLHIALREARRRGVTSGYVPRRIYKAWDHQPSRFLEAAPLALRTINELVRWLTEPKHQIDPAVRCFLCLLIFGPYPDVRTVLEVMNGRADLCRADGLEGAVLAANTSFSPAYAYGGTSALALSRWKRKRAHIPESVAEFANRVYAALPDRFRPATIDSTLAELEALTRIGNSLLMDGIARLVGVNEVALWTENIQACALYSDERRLFRGHEKPPSRDTEKKGVRPRSTGTKSELNPESLTRRLWAALPESRSAEISEEQARLGLIEWIARGQRNQVEGELVSHRILFRFALGLLEEGGLRKPSLALRTVYDYVGDTWRLLRAHPVETARMDLAAYLSHVSEKILSTGTVRDLPMRMSHMHRLHEVVGRYVHVESHPRIWRRFAETDVPDHVDCGLMSRTEAECVADWLAADIRQLEASLASRDEIYLARARYLVFLLMQCSGLRTGEARSIRFVDINIGVTAYVFARRHRWLRLKTFRARRKVALSGPLLPRLVEALRT